MSCFQWVNTMLGNLKTAASGTYHAFAFGKYGYRYLAEAQYRFNRRFDLFVTLPLLLRAAVATGSAPSHGFGWLNLSANQERVWIRAFDRFWLVSVFALRMLQVDLGDRFSFVNSLFRCEWFSFTISSHED
ncbi:MAG: hypothetical protein A3E79_17260 [Burkholderiales bacterium RIFCSPHIGHO2_12_FULL_61_11]|nr:MAG: hypothetical protein A3E79_17260 [Burkholderiales bacterium RIFCSPHIGHO2_12_FULL_61_11]